MSSKISKDIFVLIQYFMVLVKKNASEDLNVNVYEMKHKPNAKQ